MTSQNQPAVRVEDVSKTFHIPIERVSTLKERALHPLKRSGHQTLHALRDVSFDVSQGEFFGIVGRNGSGKSTLLKCMAGIYRTDAGRIFVNGRVSTFIELGVGFNPDLAARDNVMLNATMLGLSTKEAKRRFDSIIDFAELGEFVDLKLKNYSSGMMVRLAFAVMIQVDADILLIDEVLAVGDAAFQQKCFDEFGRIRRSGATVLLVTHDMAAVQRFCDRAMLLEHGRQVDLGGTERTAARYLQLNFSPEARAEQAQVAADAEAHDADRPETADAAEPDGALPDPDDADGPGVQEEDAEQTSVRLGDRKAEITGSWLEDESGRRQEVVPAGTECVICFDVAFNHDLADPLLGMNLYNSQSDMVWAANNVYAPPAGHFRAGDRATVRIAFTNVLAADRYWITPAVARNQVGLEWHDRRHRHSSFVVTDTHANGGVVSLPMEMRVVTGAAEAEPAQEARA